MDPARIWLGYDAVDNAFLGEHADAAKADAQALRRRYNLPGRYFLASARFIEKKNLITLIRAYGLYRSKLEGKQSATNCGLVLLGDGPLRQSLEAEVAAIGFGDEIKMPGFQQYEHLPVYYGLADVFVLPSATEQWGLVVNEAMASGLPVLVSTRCGCAPDLVEEGHNGYTFDPFDVSNLADLMVKVADEAYDRRAMGDASRKIIAGWSPEHFGRNLLNAASCAMSLPKRGTTAIDTLILQMLIARSSV